MSKKDEEVGKTVLSAVKSAIKETGSGGSELVGAAKNLNDMLEQANTDAANRCDFTV